MESCPYCEKREPTEEDFLRHVAFDHAVDHHRKLKMEISCPLCHVVFKDAKALKQHWLENAPEGCDWGENHAGWKCPFCNKPFADVYELNQHHKQDACDPDNRDETAEVHWAYTEKMMRLAYVEAFEHGYKHGREDEKAKEPPKVSSY